jgi:hypothetical protein
MACRRILLPWLLLLFFLSPWPVRAEDPLPSRVGRVSVVDGNVAVRPAGGEWSDSGINDPVAAGMSARTQAQGRAVLRVGPETIALGPSSEIDLAKLDAGATQIMLRQGRIGVRLPRLDPAPGIDPARSVEIDTARGGAWLLAPGEYDIAAGDERAPARIAVLDGSARFVGPGQGPTVGSAIDTAIAAGSATVVSGGAPVVASLDGAAPDDFVGWWRSASTDAADAQARRTLSPEITGYEALDGNGSWETVEGYGAVWFPTAVPDDWAPYRYGHWRWIAPWGWSWIDDMPWGFAPSHYGRWASIPEVDRLDPSLPDLEAGPPGLAARGERWGWVPGSRVADPVYAPALVAFLGTAGVGLSYPGAFGPAVAWFPLAPGDIYWPGYTSDLDTIRRINRDAQADLSTIGPGVNGELPAEIINREYPNRRFASVVPRSVFLAGRPIGPSLLQLPGQRLAIAPLLAGSPQIAPAAPHASVVASASAAARRAAARIAAASAPRLARTLHALAGLLQPRVRMAGTGAAAMRTTAARISTDRARALPVAFLVRSASTARAVGLAQSGRLTAWNARVAQSRVIAAAASHSARLRFASLHRVMPR